jgi:hypothetical protein
VLKQAELGVPVVEVIRKAGTKPSAYKSIRKIPAL